MPNNHGRRRGIWGKVRKPCQKLTRKLTFRPLLDSIMNNDPATNSWLENIDKSVKDRMIYPVRGTQTTLRTRQGNCTQIMTILRIAPKRSGPLQPGFYHLQRFSLGAIGVGPREDVRSSFYLSVRVSFVATSGSHLTLTRDPTSLVHRAKQTGIHDSTPSSYRARSAALSLSSSSTEANTTLACTLSSVSESVCLGALSLRGNINFRWVALPSLLSLSN